MSAPTVPILRLEPADFYHLLDWLAEGWDSLEERSAAKQLERLRFALEVLPEPFQGRGLALHRTLCRARIVNGEPWKETLRELRRVVSDWNSSRPPLAFCGIGGCRVAYRSPQAMRDHKRILHDVAE